MLRSAHHCAVISPVAPNRSPCPLGATYHSLCSQRVNSVQRLRHALLRADRLLEKHEDEVGECLSWEWLAV